MVCLFARASGKICRQVGRCRRRRLSSSATASGSNHSRGNDHGGTRDHDLRLLDLMARLGASLGQCQAMPFRLSVGDSRIPGAGRGVFLQGAAKRGAILTLYPGTIYSLPVDLEALSAGDEAFDLRPPEILISNEYLLRFKYGGCSSRPGIYMVDGCPRGISALAFTRVVEARGLVANHSWLEEKELKPPSPSSTAGGGRCVNYEEEERQLSVGNLINDPGRAESENVRFEIMTIPRHFPQPLLALIPSVMVSGNGDRPVVAVTASRDVHMGEELLVSYGTDPQSMGYRL